jgi:Cu/Ag efflux protein CusF
MMSISKWAFVAVAVALFTGQASAADRTAAGKVKSINPDKKQFVLTDLADKDWTITLAEDVVMNRGGKESKADLKVGDPVHICYDKGVLTWTAHYILVREDDNKNSELISGVVKGYDADKKEITVTDQDKKNWTYGVGDAKVRLAMVDTRIGEIKIGDNVLIIVDTVDGKSTLKSVMAKRAK